MKPVPKFILSSLCASLLAVSAQAADFLSGTAKFSAEGTVEQGVEKGVLNGVAYKVYYSDGSGIFAGKEGNNLGVGEQLGSNWDIECKTDAMTDKKTCSMHRGDLWVYVHGTGKAVVSIGAEHFPGTSVAIRIDGGKPISTSSANDGDFSGAASASLIAQLKKAKSVTTRYMKWPYQQYIDDTRDAFGFKEAFQYITWAVKHGK
ncbi:hypothetical protein ACFQUU_02525 [Herbaspirillum sp. GCM10030257]|uniref:hypothetical protein n=1 Tax=Herbaspirillum sp. GCM10030257 TaxID=3273393 RepID=UPI00361819FE